MPENNLKDILPSKEISFLKDLERVNGEILQEVDFLFKDKAPTEEEDDQEFKKIYKRGYIVDDGHIVGLSLRTHFQTGLAEYEDIGEPLPELPDTISNLKELKYLDLVGNQLSSINYSSIYKLDKLETLNLGTNLIHELDYSIGNLTKLIILNLERNQLEHIPETIGNLINLEELNLQFNQLIELPESIGNLKSIKKIELKRNRLNKLPESFFKLKTLIHLNLEENNFTILPESFGNLTKLEFLDLRESMITNLPESFNNLIQLKYLKIGSIDNFPSNLAAFEALEILDVSSKEITSIPKAISNLKSLKELELDLNQVKSIPSSIGDLISLEHLLIGATQSEYLPESIGNLINLKYLYLWENKIKEIPPTIGKLENLKVLHLSLNQISNIPKEIGNLKKLEKLNLRGNHLTKLPRALKNLENLTELQLENNKFSQLPLWLWKLKNLKKMYIFNQDKNPWQGEWKDVVTRDLMAIKDFCREKDTLKVFISHAVVDFKSHKIKELSDFLETQENIYQAYFCEEDLRGNIDEFMNLIVPQCHVVIFIGTQQSIYHSVDCKHEIELARKHGLIILSVKGNDVDWSEFENMGLSIDSGIDFSEENFEIYCKVIQNHLDQIHEDIEKKEDRDGNLEKDVEEIYTIIFNYLDSPRFKEIYRNAQNDFESFKLELQDANMNRNDVLFKLSNIISKIGGDL